MIRLLICLLVAMGVEAQPFALPQLGADDQGVAVACSPTLLGGEVVYYDVLCTNSIILNTTNNAVLKWKNQVNNALYDLTNNIIGQAGVNASSGITGPVFHVNGSLNASNTANIYFSQETHVTTLNQALQVKGAGNVAQPFTFLYVLQPFGYTNGNITTDFADFNGELQPTQVSVSENTTPSGRVQVYQGGGGTFQGGFTFGTNCTVLTCVVKGTTSYMRTNGSLYAYGDAGLTNFICDATRPFSLGGFQSPGFFAGFRFILWDHELSTNDLQSAENKAMTDFGITRYIVSENFENAGTPAGWGSGGTVTFHNTSGPLEGTGDVLVGTGTSFANPAQFGPCNEIWGFCLFKVTTLPSSSANFIGFWDYTTGLTMVGGVQLDNLGKISLVVNGSGGAVMTDAITINTLYYCWIHYKTGTGNAVVSCGISTTGTEPTGGTSFVGTTTGTSTSTAGYYVVETQNSAVSHFDHVRVATTDPGNSPP